MKLIKYNLETLKLNFNIYLLPTLKVIYIALIFTLGLSALIYELSKNL